MWENSLGLFDTPPDRREIRLGLIVVALLFAAFLFILPVRDVRLREVSAFVPTVDAMMAIGDTIAAALLYGQASLFRSRALMVLATAYLLSAQLLLAHALTFPGAFSPGGLFRAGVNTTAWIATVQRIAFPIAIIVYVRLRHMEAPSRVAHDRSAARIAAWVLASVAMAGSVVLLATLGHDFLPAFYVNSADVIYSNAVSYQLVTFALLLVAAGMLFRNRSSVLDLWLLVALSGWIIQSVLIALLHARFTAGFYYLYGLLLASHLVVLIALIAESNRLYVRLAHSTVAREVERKARLMSMDAVAAAISTQVGQALAAISLNASVGTRSLQTPNPNIQKAIASLGEIRESAQRSFDMVGSVRAIFANAPEATGEFGLNAMIEEMAPLLQGELAASKIALDLRLGEEMPPLSGSRVQLQQVLLNLVKNATESAATKKNGRRRITVSSRAEGRKIVLEVSEDGTGVATGEVPDFFEAIRSRDDDIGLSLCRSIVEEHGGRIWASHDEKLGETFHVELPVTSTLPPSER